MILVDINIFETEPFLEFTSLPFKILTFAKRAIKTNLGTPSFPVSDTGFPESLISWMKMENNQLTYNLLKKKKET